MLLLHHYKLVMQPQSNSHTKLVKEHTPVSTIG